jgi:hypothetical protein
MPTDRPNMAAGRRLMADMRRIVEPWRVPIRGEISHSNEKEIRSAIDRAVRSGKIDLEIDSPGGLTVVAARIERDLRGTGLRAEAYVGRRCASAAVDLLMTAPLRWARRDSTFHLHSTFMHRNDMPRIIGADALKSMTLRLDADDRRHRAVLAKLRLPPDLFARAASRDGLELDALGAVAFDLVHGIL